MRSKLSDSKQFEFRFFLIMEQVRQNFTTALIFLLISTTLFTFDRLGAATSLKRVFAVPFEFIQFPVILAKTTLASKIEFLVNLAEIAKENQVLAERQALLQAENIRLQNLLTENQALKAQFGFFGTNVKSIPARIVGTSRFLAIQPESMDGVKVGSTVTLGNNFVGKVSEIGFKLAKVRLPQDPASSIPAVAVTPVGRVYGVLVGRYGSLQVLEKVEKSEIVTEGAIVETSGEADIEPGLVLGQISKVQKIDASPFLEIEVESFLDFSKLSTVFVLSE